MENSYISEKKGRMMGSFNGRWRLLFVKNWPIEIGVLLIFVLPPIGMLWLFILGWLQIQREIKANGKFPFNMTVFFFLCLMVSTVAAAIAAKNLEYILALAMLLGYLGLYLRAKESSRVSLFKGYQLMVIIGGCYSILTKLLPEPLRANPIWGLLLGTKWLGGSTLDPRLVGSAYNPNFASFLLLISFSFVLSRMLKQKKIFSSKLKLDWLMLLFLGYGIVATQSRACVVTMLIIFLMFLLRYRRKLGLWASIVVVLFLPFLSHLMPRSDSIGMSTDVREQIWLNSIRVWEQHPLFGTTPIGFQEVYSEFGAPVPHAHDILLAFFTEYGTLGGLAFVVFLVWSGVKYLSLVKNSSDHKIMVDTFILSLPILLFTGIFDHPLSSPQTALAVIPLLGFWDGYTEPVSKLDYEVGIGGIYRFFPAKFLELAIFRKREKKKEHNMLGFKNQDYKFLTYLSLFLIIIELMSIVRVM